MSLIGKFLGKEEQPKESPITAILPSEIYNAGVLELKDVIAPSALKITPRELNL